MSQGLPIGDPPAPPDYPNGPEPFTDPADIARLVNEYKRLKGDGTFDPRPPTDASPFGLLYTRSALESIPPPDTTFGPYIVSGGVNMLYGRWGSAKSFLLLSWAAALATGTPWNGHAADAANVIYWAAEGLGGLHMRLAAWENHHGVNIGDMAFRAPQKSPALDREVSYDALAEIIETTKTRHLFIDTLIRVKGALRENEADELGGYLLTELAHRICDEYGCSVTLAHHIGHEAKDRPRGSSSIADNLDALYEIRDAGGGLKTLHVRKLKDQPMDERPDTFKLLAVGDSAVLIPTDDIPLTENDQEIYDALIEHSPNGEWVSTTLLHGLTGSHRNVIRKALAPLVGRDVDYRSQAGHPSEYRVVKETRTTQLEVHSEPKVHPSDELPDPW